MASALALCLSICVCLLIVTADHFNHNKDCGVSKPTVSPNIINGTEAQIGKYPWHVGIYKRSGVLMDDWVNICGGSIITNRIVLTVANCVEMKSKENIRVAAGKYYQAWDHTEPYAAKINVSMIRIPPQYKSAALNYTFDIALLLLSETVAFNSFIMPVCRNVNGDFDMSQVSVAHVAGWGITGPNLGPSPTLLHADVDIIGPEKCREKAPGRWSFDKICSLGKSGKSIERGYGGGGVTAISNGVHYIIGIVSLKLNDITLLTNVSWTTHANWLNEEIEYLSNQ